MSPDLTYALPGEVPVPLMSPDLRCTLPCEVP